MDIFRQHVNHIAVSFVLAFSTSASAQEAPQFIARTDLNLSGALIVQAGDLISGTVDANGKITLLIGDGKRGVVNRSDVADMNEAIDVLSDLIAKEPQEARYYSARANVWAVRGELPNAIEDASRAITASGQKDSMAFVNRGAFYASAGEYDKAISDYIIATHVNPQNYSAYSNLAAAHISKQQYDKAIEVCSSVINVDAKNPAHFIQRGVAHRFLKDWDAAIADFSKALELENDNQAALGSRGFVNYLKGDHAAAVKDFDAIVKLKPDDAMAWNNRGYNRQLSGDYSNALVDYNKAVELLPTYAVAWQNKAWLLATCPDDSVRDGQAALAAAKKACDQRESKVAPDIKALAAAYAEIGDFEKAVEHQSTVVDMVDVDGEAVEKEILAAYRAKKPHRSGPADGEK